MGGETCLNKSLSRGMEAKAITAMVCLSEGMTLTIHTTQMKLFNAIAAAVVLGGSLSATAIPASAQYYGNGYGYNNNTRNSYGYNPCTPSRGRQIDMNGYQPSRRSSYSYCSSLSMSQYGC